MAGCTSDDIPVCQRKVFRDLQIALYPYRNIDGVGILPGLMTVIVHAGRPPGLAIVLQFSFKVSVIFIKDLPPLTEAVKLNMTLFTVFHYNV